MFDGPWAVLNIRTKEYEESYKTKPQALNRVSSLIERDGPHWGVVPLSEEKWQTLRREALKRN